MSALRSLHKYLERNRLPLLTPPLPTHRKAEMVVVIPCYDEPDVCHTLDNLRACAPTDRRTMVVVVFNSSVRSTAEGIAQNRFSFDEVKTYAARFDTPHFWVVPYLVEDMPRKHAGVGLARRYGMDLAVQHFLHTEQPRGVIISLDADCEVSPNYLSGIHHAFASDETLCVTVQNFYHRVEPNTPEESAIRKYEAYIRYFSRALQHIGFPYPLHTIGSAFAVSVLAYVAVGGMGRQQGGEDFYFLQKAFTFGNSRFLSDVVVYPLARYSTRIPFGTGPMMQKIVAEHDGSLPVYSPEAIDSLGQLFALLPQLHTATQPEVVALTANLHPALLRYLQTIAFADVVAECQTNTSTYEAFRKRFFHHFDGFRIIRYLNSVHPVPFPYLSIAEDDTHFL